MITRTIQKEIVEGGLIVVKCRTCDGVGDIAYDLDEYPCKAKICPVCAGNKTVTARQWLEYL